MKLLHATQRGGGIVVTGPPFPIGEPVALPVDEKGEFEVPDAQAQELLRILGPVVTMAPVSPKRKGSEA